MAVRRYDFVSGVETDDCTSDSSGYTDTFNAVADWGAAAGGYYTITYTAATHGRGTKPVVQVSEDDGTNYVPSGATVQVVKANGNVNIKVLEAPDGRFAGLVVII